MRSIRSSEPSKIGQVTIDTASIQGMFELDYQYEIFLSRCQDTGEKPDIEKAKMFKETFNKINSKKFPNVLNLNSMRLGVNTIMKLISILENNKFKSINLADNAISEYGMHAIKNLLCATQIEALNIGSNMISEIGLSLVLEEFIKNNHLKVLDFGVLEGSIRKNSFGIDGARCLAAILLQNKVLECVKLEDNDIGINGAEIISIPLKKNKTLKELKISENLIKTQGAEYILQNAIFLESLDLSKNFIKSSIGPFLYQYLEVNKNLKKLNLEYNELLSEGARTLFEGILVSNLVEVNIRGNGLGNRGLSLIANVLLNSDEVHGKLKHLDISNNDITHEGVDDLISILSHLDLRSLNVSKNNLGDSGIIELLAKTRDEGLGCNLERLDISGCKASDKAFMFLLESINELPELKSIKCNDNYISEKYEKVYVDLLGQNKTLTSLSLSGNRISLSCMKVIKRIIDRNLKEFEEKEPKKMKSELNNMKEKQKKIKDAQERLEKQKTEIRRLEESKIRLHDNIIRLEKEEKDKREEYEDLLKRRSEEVDLLVVSNRDKVENLEKMKQEKQRSLDKLDEDLDKLKEKRKSLENQLNDIKNDGEVEKNEFKNKRGI